MVFYTALVGPNLRGAFNENDPTNPVSKYLLKLLTYSWCQAVASNELFSPTCQTWCLEKGLDSLRAGRLETDPGAKLQGCLRLESWGQWPHAFWTAYRCYSWPDVSGVPWFLSCVFAYREWKLALSFLVLLCFIYLYIGFCMGTTFIASDNCKRITQVLELIFADR